MTRALIVGASSPLGEAVRNAFTADGHEVVGASRSGGDGSRIIDVTDPGSVLSLLRDVRPSVVVYLARPELPSDLNCAGAAIETALDALRRFAIAARDEGAERLLFASSSAVYGTESSEPREEEDETPAPGTYAQLKLWSEEVLAELSSNRGLATLALRIFNVYGPGFHQSLVNRLQEAAGGGDPPTIFPTDLFVRDYVHSSDVAAAFVAAAVSPAPFQRVINVGTGVGTGNLALTSLIPKARWVEGPPLDRPSVCVANTSRLRDLLGEAPPPRLLQPFSPP